MRTNYVEDNEGKTCKSLIGAQANGALQSGTCVASLEVTGLGGCSSETGVRVGCN